MAQGTPRPETVRVEPGSTVDPSFILKRGHSGWGDFVYNLPSKKKWKGAWDSKYSYAYFQQPYIDTLRELGEMRCYFYGSELCYVVHTLFDDESGDINATMISDVCPNDMLL